MSATPAPIPPHPLAAPGGAATAPDNYLTHRRGLWSWLTTLDHKRIGVMYLIGILFFFFLAGLMAMLVRTQLLTPAGLLFHADQKWSLPGPGTAKNGLDVYNEVFTLHGAMMIFLFIIPSIPAAFGNFVLPMMLGAKDVAFPRLNLLSWYLYVTGAVFFILALVLGGVDTGWTFYTPYSTTFSMSGLIPVVFGAFILGFSSILTGINFIASIHMLRPPGMTWFRMPLMLWGLYGTAIIQVLATPVLAITLLLLIAERALQVGIFDPKYGGDPILFQHFFWFYSHPAVYIMILPGMGIISEVISPMARKHIFGYRAIALSSVAIAILGFLVWGHHMFTTGQSTLMNAVFSVLTFAVAIPSAIKVFNWLATLYKGSLDLRAPMLYCLMFLMLFAIGGLTGLFLGALASDIQLHQSYFIVAHFHYTMMGGTVVAFLAGLHYWWPKMFGRMYNQAAAALAAGLIFIGFNLTFIPQFIMGSRGMPRRYATYSAQDLPRFAVFHQLSTIGAYILLLAFAIMAGYLVHSLFRGRRAPANPWGSASLEWKTASPPPHDNFADLPTVGDPYDFSRLRYDPDIDGYVPTPAKPGDEPANLLGS
jgi:cytochrome c oxidase subunit 1